MASPIPRLPPVTRTLRILARQFAAGACFDRSNEADHRRYYVGCEACPAERHDLRLHPIRIAVPVLENHIGNDDRADDRALACPDARQADTLVTVDHRFDFLGMYLEAADIDDAAAASGEMATAAALLDDVAAVDKSVFIGENEIDPTGVASRHPLRFEAERPVFDLELDL